MYSHRFAPAFPPLAVAANPASRSRGGYSSDALQEAFAAGAAYMASMANDHGENRASQDGVVRAESIQQAYEAYLDDSAASAAYAASDVAASAAYAASDAAGLHENDLLRRSHAAPYFSSYMSSTEPVHLQQQQQHQRMSFGENGLFSLREHTPNARALPSYSNNGPWGEQPLLPARTPVPGSLSAMLGSSGLESPPASPNPHHAN
jgi:hypothetical protein